MVDLPSQNKVDRVLDRFILISFLCEILKL
jgi:hypothetical protein